MSGFEIVSNLNENCGNLRCWHCTYNFKNKPVYLPEKYYENKFYVFGYFCTFNCAMKYNNTLNDYKMDERTSLIYHLFRSSFDNVIDKIITPAPPKEALVDYGGTMTIEEFRHSTDNGTSNFRLLLPPMLPITPIIEEDYVKDSKNNNSNTTNIPLNMKHLYKSTGKLKRSTPLKNSKFSLEKTMGIKRKSKII